jgi:hypothetical protein
MNDGELSCNGTIKKALKKAGLSIEGITKQGKKTVISVFKNKQPFATKTTPTEPAE